MIGISKIYRSVCNLNCHPNTRKFWKANQRYYIKGIDNESYLNKRNVKGVIDPLGYFTAIFPVACFGLAIWQVNRKQWKDKLMLDMKSRMYLPPAEIPQDLTDRMKMEYRKVKARGTFDHSREMYIGPRSLIIDSKFAEPIPFLSLQFDSKRECNIGFIVVTPFKLIDRDVEILVNRGWVPMSMKNPFHRLEGQIEGEIEIEGVVRLKEKEAKYVSQGKEDSRTFKHRDLLGMAELANTSHFYIDAVVESTVPGGPIGGQTQVNIKNDHMEYIATWSILGLYLSNMWYRRYIRKVMN